MKLLPSLSLTILLGAASCTSTQTSYRVGPGTEDLVLHRQKETLYTRTSNPPGPLLDKLTALCQPPANVWRLHLSNGRIVDHEPVFDTDSDRQLRFTGTRPEEIHYAPLALYLHPTDTPTHLYVLNNSKKMPGFFIVPLAGQDGQVTFVSANSDTKAFKNANSLAVHPDGTVYVSIFKPGRTIGKRKPILVGNLSNQKVFPSVIAYDQKSRTWRTVVGDLPGANGMAFHSGATGKVELYLSDHTRKQILRLDATNPMSLTKPETVRLPLHPDNLTLDGDTLYIAGQRGIGSSAMNAIVFSRWPVYSGILEWNITRSGCTPRPTDLQPPWGGPAVATAVPHGDVIYCSHVTGSTIRPLSP